MFTFQIQVDDVDHGDTEPSTEGQGLPPAQGPPSPNDSGMETDSTQHPNTGEAVTETTAEVMVVDDDSVTGAQAGTEKKESVGDAGKGFEPTISGSDLFATVAQDRILGLIGALMPPNRQVI